MVELDSDAEMHDFLSWDWIPMSLEAWRSLRFEHVVTRCRAPGSDDCWRGDTLWTAIGTKGKIGLAWEWVESEPGSGLYFASFQDLMSNVLLTDTAGVEVGDHQLATERLSSIESLPWRTLVAARITSVAH